jgi:glycosyltransferase involved in cell wall biosynthesis
MASNVSEQDDIDVSVVIAVKNEALHVEEAVRSVLVQSGLEFECIVVNDNSTDATGDILAKLASEYPRLRVFDNPKKGKNSAFNYGMNFARGRYATLFAGDDLMPQGSLRGRLDAVLAVGDQEYVLGLCKIQTMSDDPKFNGHVVPKSKGRGSLTGLSYFMSRAVRAKIFPVPEHLPNEDTWMELAYHAFTQWVRVHSDIIGCHWRMHAGNSINMKSDFAEYNRKYTLRMTAIQMFYDQHCHELDDAAQLDLRMRAKCEKARARGSIVGVLCNGAPLIERLRALSTTNAFFYNLRRSLYGFFSGF